MSEAIRPGDWAARNAQPVPPNDSKPPCTSLPRAVSALDAIPPDTSEREHIAAAWALEFGRAGLAQFALWWARASAAGDLAPLYCPCPGVDIALVYMLAIRHGWLDPSPAAVRSREARAKQRAVFEKRATRLAERERKERERNEAKAAREAARGAKRAITRRKAA